MAPVTTHLTMRAHRRGSHFSSLPGAGIFLFHWGETALNWTLTLVFKPQKQQREATRIYSLPLSSPESTQCGLQRR